MSSESKKFILSAFAKIVAAVAAALVLALAVAPLRAQQLPSSPALLSQAANGSAVDASVALRVSTLGIGIEVAKELNDHFAARLGFNYFKKHFDEVEEDVNYDGNLRLQSVSLIGDWFPSSTSSIHLSAGVLFNNTTIEAVGVPGVDGYFTINGHRYTNDEVGNLLGDATLPSASPYLGLGFGRPVRGSSSWQFLADVGVALSKTTLKLNATNSGTTPGLAADLAAEQAHTQSTINKWLAVYPVASFGLAFRF